MSAPDLEEGELEDGELDDDEPVAPVQATDVSVQPAKTDTTHGKNIHYTCMFICKNIIW